MQSKAFARSKDELAAARQKFESMKSATDIRVLDQLWSEFLTHIQRIFTKLQKATEHGPSKGWFDKLKNHRKSDSLLRYLLHARNADEHGIDPITNKTKAGIGINPKTGNTLYIDRLTISGGTIQMGPEMTKNAKIIFIPAKIELVPVRDRGEEYEVPTAHLDKELTNLTLIEAAELGLEFWQKIVSEAEERFTFE